MPAPNKRTTGPPGPGILLPAQRHAAPPSASRHSITADFTKKLICIAVIEMPRFTVVAANMGSTDVQFLGFAAVRYICFQTVYCYSDWMAKQNEKQGSATSRFFLEDTVAANSKI